MNLNNYALVQEHVQKLYDKSRSENGKVVDEFVASLNLQSKTTEEQILFLFKELSSIDRSTQTFEQQEYILLANYPETISKIIYHRLLFFEKNECHLIAEANLINQKRSRIIKLLEETKTKLPEFRYEDFLQGKYNPVFYDLKQKPFSTSDDNYYKMRTWQNERLIQAITLEANHFVKAFRQCWNGEASNTESVKCETEQLETIFKEGKNWTQDTLESEIFKLKALTNSLTPNNLADFHFAMRQFLKQGINQARFTPDNLSSVISSYQRRGIKSKPISHPPILCLSFLLYDDWLESIKADRKNIASPIKTNYEKLFNNSFDEAEMEGDAYIRNFNRRQSALTTSKEYKDMVVEELNRLHGLYEESNCEKYINFIFNEEAIKAQFIANCIFEGNPQVQSKMLKQTIIVNNEADFLFRQLTEKYLDPVLSKSVKSIFTLELQIINIINSMVPDSVTIQRMLLASSKMIGELNNTQKPSIFILKDLQKELLELFDVTEKRLEDHINRLNDDTIYEYTKTTLRKLIQRCRESKKSDGDLLDRIKQLKTYLSEELDLIKSIAKPVDIAKLLKQKPFEKKKFSFGYKKIGNKPLETVIRALVLNSEIGLLDDRTRSEDLVALLSTNDIDSLPFKKIIIACKTSQFRYIMVKLRQSLLPKFKPNNIEKCGRFYSKNETMLLANNLNPSKSTAPHDKLIIDAIFNQVQ